MSAQASSVGIAMESLEERSMLSGAAGHLAPMRNTVPTYDLMGLAGYNRLGAVWYYNCDWSTDGDLASGSGSGSESVAVRSRTVSLEGHAASVIQASSSGGTYTQEWYSDRTGTYVGAMLNTIGSMRMNMQIHHTLLAPVGLTVGGRGFASSGAFDGTVSTTYEGTAVTGTVAGTAKTLSRLLSTQSTALSIGTFNTIEGYESVTLAGRINLHANGQSMSATFTEKAGLTFWAAPGIGIVSEEATLDVSITLADAGTMSTSMLADAVMTKYYIPSRAARTIATPAADMLKSYAGVFRA